MPPTLAVLVHNRDFRNLFLAQLVVFGGDWFVLVPLVVLLPELTGSGLWGALVLSADTGIVALLLPFTGTVADRVDRRKIMIIANLAAIGAVLLLLTVRSAATAWVALAAMVAFAVAKAFYSPASSAALPNVVPDEDLAVANALSGAAWGTMAVVGASLGGVLSAAFSPYTCFLVTAVGLAVAAALAWRIHRPLQAARGGGQPPRTWPAICEAMRYIRRERRVLALVTVKSAAGMGNGVLAVFPVLAASFGVGALGAGLLFAVRGLGAVIGPLLLRRVLAHRSWLLPGLAVSMASYGLAYLGVAVVPWFALVLALVMVAHVAGGGNWTMSNFALQTEVPDALRGRVFATDMMLATLAISASLLVVGAFVDHVPARVLIACCGGATLLYAIGWHLATARLARAEPGGPGPTGPQDGPGPGGPGPTGPETACEHVLR
ncbi:MAG TPA: MFS transporter [Micromonosporaceae bacterium]|nr:MFS transporter [Micromonosporaceae bacterium]